MGKLTTYVVIMTGLLLLFYFTGLLPEGNPAADFLTLLTNPENMQFSEFALQIGTVINAIALTGAIIVGIIVGEVELVAVGGFAIFLVNLLWGFTAVYTKIASYDAVLATLLFSPIMFLFVMTIIEWWRGRD